LRLHISVKRREKARENERFYLFRGLWLPILSVSGAIWCKKAQKKWAFLPYLRPHAAKPPKNPFRYAGVSAFWGVGILFATNQE
jgi:hypothetical protein